MGEQGLPQRVRRHGCSSPAIRVTRGAGAGSGNVQGEVSLRPLPGYGSSVRAPTVLTGTDKVAAGDGLPDGKGGRFNAAEYFLELGRARQRE
jgi:hypothetical protein